MAVAANVFLHHQPHHASWSIHTRQRGNKVEQDVLVRDTAILVV